MTIMLKKPKIKIYKTKNFKKSFCYLPYEYSVIKPRTQSQLDSWICHVLETYISKEIDQQILSQIRYAQTKKKT